MKFIYQYRTADNKQHQGEIKAASREAAFSTLKSQGIKPSKVIEAPGFLNKLLGRGKRWIAIALLAIIAALSTYIAFKKPNVPTTATAPSNSSTKPKVQEFDDTVRRQVIGDIAIIEQGIRDGWSNVFTQDQEGERFLASFAIPGVPAGLRNTSEAEIKAALERVVSLQPSDTIEARQIKAMVEGMKQELRQFLEDGGTIVEYGKLLVQRQEEELGYYNRAKKELERMRDEGTEETQIMSLWTKRNDQLRRMGIRPLPIPDTNL